MRRWARGHRAHEPAAAARRLTRLLNDPTPGRSSPARTLPRFCDPLRGELPLRSGDRYIVTGSNDVPGYRAFGALTAAASDTDIDDVLIDRATTRTTSSTAAHDRLPKGIVHPTTCA